MNENLNLVCSRLLLEAVASSLTELFSKDLCAATISGCRADWTISKLVCTRPLKTRPSPLYVYENAGTRAEQDKGIQALRHKCDILWARLDAPYFAYVQPGWPPPRAFT